MSPLKMILGIFAFLLSSALAAADHTWQQVSDFAATGLHASGSNVVAWNALQYAVSVDDGATWSNPIAPTTRGIPEEVRLAVASPAGIYVLTASGKVFNVAAAGGAAASLPGPVVTNLALDGSGHVFSETVDGSVGVLAAPPVAKGRIYRAVQNGVLVETQQDSLVLATATGAGPVAFKGEKLPAVFELAPLTTGGGDRWTTSRAAIWIFKDGKVMSLSNRQAKAVGYGFGADGYHELLGFRGLQITYLQGNTGLEGHWRTRDLPQDATVLTITPVNFVVADPKGIFFVQIAHG